jgi:anti-anti-sigma factor
VRAVEVDLGDRLVAGDGDARQAAAALVDLDDSRDAESLLLVADGHAPSFPYSGVPVDNLAPEMSYIAQRYVEEGRMRLNCELKTVKSVPRVAIISIQGAIDPLTITALQEELATADGLGFRIIVLDLEGIRYINSAGLAYLVNLGDSLVKRRGALLLVGAQPKVKVVFELMGVAKFFKLFKTVDSALGAIANARRRKATTPLRKQT